MPFYLAKVKCLKLWPATFSRFIKYLKSQKNDNIEENFYIYGHEKFLMEKGENIRKEKNWQNE